MKSPMTTKRAVSRLPPDTPKLPRDLLNWPGRFARRPASGVDEVCKVSCKAAGQLPCQKAKFGRNTCQRGLERNVFG